MLPKTPINEKIREILDKNNNQIRKEVNNFIKSLTRVKKFDTSEKNQISKNFIFMGEYFDKNIIIKKFYFENDFSKITEFWKENLGCSFSDLNENSYFIVIDKNVINKIKMLFMSVDCRLFSLFYSEIDKVFVYEKACYFDA